MISHLAPCLSTRTQQTSLDIGLDQMADITPLTPGIACAGSLNTGNIFIISWIRL